VRSSLVALVAVAALVVTACTSDGDVEVEVATVEAGVVVQTVAAAGELEPAGRATVTAPAGGEVAELLVGDGDEVEAGDPLVRLASDTIDQQVAQAESAVDAADGLAASAASAGVDVSPVLGAFRSQLDAVFPPLITGLSEQIDALERAAETSREAAREQLEAQDPEELGIEEDDLEGLLDALDDPEMDEALRSARARLAEAEAGYRDARSQLSTTESQLRSQAQQATAAQQAAADAQREQAELVLETARARIDDLTIVAPIAGVVELSRGDDGEGAPPLGDLGDLGDLGGLGGLGGTQPGGGGNGAGPIREGSDVGPGQTLLTIYDVSSFTVRADVDELDIVDVEVGQDVVVLVDAFAELEFSGVVSRIAMTPRRPAGGGAIFPVTVDLVDVPDDIRLRIGLTASSEIEIRRVEGDTVVPTSALLRRGGAEVVFVLRDGVAREVPVTVEALGDQTAALSGDLRPGDEVVTFGVEVVEDGTEVEVVG
jgi:HlyD family secretion protein